MCTGVYICPFSLPGRSPPFFQKAHSKSLFTTRMPLDTAPGGGCHVKTDPVEVRDTAVIADMLIGEKVWDITGCGRAL